MVRQISYYFPRYLQLSNQVWVVLGAISGLVDVEFSLKWLKLLIQNCAALFTHLLDGRLSSSIPQNASTWDNSSLAAQMVKLFDHWLFTLLCIVHWTMYLTFVYLFSHMNCTL